MKTSKLLFLGMLIVAMGMSGSVYAAALSDDLLSDAETYKIGDTVCYTVSLTSYGGDLTNVSTYLWVPTMEAYGTCTGTSATPGGTLIVGPITLSNATPPATGETVLIDCIDNVDLAYEILPGDFTDADGPLLTAKLATVATDGSTQDCDAETKTVTILPPEPDIVIVKTGSLLGFCQGLDPTAITYTYNVTTGTSDVAMNIISVIDDTCGPLVYQSGDNNPANGVLDLTETWVYTCSTSVTDTTLNIVEVTAQDIYAVTDPVTGMSEWLVEAVEPPGVEVSLTPAEICEGGSSLACAVVTGAIGEIAYLWSTGETTECITVDDGEEVCVDIEDLSTHCVASACATLTVWPNPTCSIEIVEPPVCPSEGGNYLAVIDAPLASGGTWEITAGEGWAIEGSATSETVEYSVGPDASDCATFTLTVFTSDGCEGECSIEVCCTGDTYCGFTQGFYGNEGGKACDGQTTREIIDAALFAAGDSITVGMPGNSIEFTSTDCIIDLLPAGGPAKAIRNGDWLCTALHTSMLKKVKNDVARSKNVAVGQAVALTLNILLDGCVEDASPLGSFAIPADGILCTMEEGEDCPQTYSFPESLQGLTAAEILADLNKALAGQATDSGATLAELSGAADDINNAFDECRTKVACPVEICGNGLDDDCDGLTDFDDPDCQP